MAQEWVQIGRVRSVNPGRREVRIAPAPGHSQAFESMTWLQVVLRDGETMRCRVAAMRGGEAPVATLALGVPRDHVARMKGAAVLLEEERAVATVKLRKHADVAAGMRVIGPDDAIIGVITDLYRSGVNDACIIEKTGGGVMLLPLIEQVVALVDPEAAVMRVNDIAPYAVEE